MYFRYFQVYIRPILHLNLVVRSWKVMSILSWLLRSIRIPMVQVQILQKSKNISKNMEHQMCKADQHNDQALRNEFDLWLSNRLEDNHQDGKNIFYFFLIYNNFFKRVILGQNWSNWVKLKWTFVEVKLDSLNDWKWTFMFKLNGSKD